MDIATALAVSARGMDAQTARLRVIAENLANQDTTGTSPGADPYRRKTITFENRLDRSLGADTVRVRRIAPDQGALPQRFDPSHPAADAQGYVRTPNLNVLEATRGMLTRTIDLLK
jgi:flagellar basal-body rod protein FlgC